MEMDKWMVITFKEDGPLVAGIIQECDFTEGIHTDILNGQRFESDVEANSVCEELAEKEGYLLFGDYVDRYFACPSCGNRDMNEQIYNQKGEISCLVCGKIYDPAVSVN